MACRLAAAALIGSLAAGTALAAPGAETVVLDGRQIAVAAPEGYCPLAPAQPREAAIISYAARLQAGRNQLVLAFADCAELAQFRAGGRQDFDHHGLILAVMQDGAVRHIDAMSRAEFIDLVAKSMPEVDPASVNAELRERVAAAGGPATLGELKPLGALDRNADALYVGVVVGSADARAAQLAVMGLTLVNEIPLAIYLYEPLADAGVQQLVAAQRANLHAFITANAALEPRGFWAAAGLPWIVAAAVAATLLIAVLVVLRFRLFRRTGE